MVTVAPMLNAIQQNHMLDIAAREIAGNNTPHVIIVRTPEERVEQIISQFGNSGVFFGGGLLLSKLADFAQNRLLRSATQDATHWAHLGRSFGLYGLLGSLMYSSSQFRNWVTLKRTGTIDFSDMIGETNHKAKQEDQTQQVEAAKAECVRKIKRNVFIGSGILAGGLALGHSLGALKVALPSVLRKEIPLLKGSFLNAVGLSQGKFSKLPDVGALLCWTLPTYAGLFVGSRDEYEKKETALRFGAFLLSFFLMPNVVEAGIEKVLASHPSKFFGSGKNLAWLAKLATSFVMCGSMPTVVNFGLTRMRVRQKEGLKQTQTAQPVATTLTKPTTPTVVQEQAAPYVRQVIQQPQQNPATIGVLAPSTIKPPVITMNSLVLQQPITIAPPSYNQVAENMKYLYPLQSASTP